MDPRRVVVTGLGALTPAGNTADEFWSSLKQARSGIGPITKFDAFVKSAQGEFLYPTRIAGEVRNFDLLKYVDKKEARRLDPFLQYAMACSVMAVEDADLDTTKVDGDRFGVLISSGIGGIQTLLSTHDTLREKGPDRVSPFFIPMMIVNMASGLVSMRFGAKGPNSSVITACATRNHAIGDALRLIQRGDAHHMTAPQPEGDGAGRAMAAALRDARLDASEVGYINAQGPSTPYNDKFETLAIKRVFGELFFLMIRRPPRSTLFPYPTLFC